MLGNVFQERQRANRLNAATGPTWDGNLWCVQCHEQLHAGLLLCAALRQGLQLQLSHVAKLICSCCRLRLKPTELKRLI